MNNYRYYKRTWIFLEESKEKLLSKEEAKSVLKEKGLMIRNTYEFDTDEETSFWFVIKDKIEDISELPASTRTKIRKALKTYNIKKIELDELESVAYKIITSAEETYKIKSNAISKRDYVSIFERIRKRDGYECWCVENKTDGEMVGFSINFIKEDSCEYDYLKCTAESIHNSSYPFYGLFYTMNQYYLGEKKLKYVSDGSRSITEHSNIQPFLMYNFKFRKAYCKLKVHYKWWFGVVVKMLFPFRNIIPFRNVKAILRMEEYSRSFK